MSRPVPELPFTLRASKTQTVIFLLTSLAFAAGSFMMVRDGDARGYYVGGFFLFCSLALCCLLHPRAGYLTLGESGFQYCFYFRKIRVSWSQVAEFGVTKPGLGKRVGWNLLPVKSRDADGFEDELPNDYGMAAEELAEWMEQVRARHAPKVSD